MQQVKKDAALTKKQFHIHLQQWLKNNDEVMVGPEEVIGCTNWIYIKDKQSIYALHADTKYPAVEQYLQLVALYGDDMEWHIVASQRGKMTAVAYGPEKRRIKPFYMYFVSTIA
ncbi:MAG: hypothetical protein ACF8OB_02620 [Phycisphaeraceae bacterium JB051]